MKIFGHPMSTCTRKVLATIAETQTPYELVLVDFAKGEHKQQPHLSRQPWGKVPALEDDGFTMFESRPMARYIAGKANSPLIPADLRARAMMEQWMSIEVSYFSSPAMKYVYHTVFQRPQEQAVLDAARAELDHTMPVIEAQLAKHAYLAGEGFSLADICYMPYVEYSIGGPLKPMYEQYPAFKAWWERVSTRPSWMKVAGRG